MYAIRSYYAISNMNINTSSTFSSFGVGLVATNNGTLKNISLYTTAPLTTTFDYSGGITGRNLASGLVLNSLFNDTTQIYTVEVGRGKIVGENTGTIIYDYPIIGVDVITSYSIHYTKLYETSGLVYQSQDVACHYGIFRRCQFSY